MKINNVSSVSLNRNQIENHTSLKTTQTTDFNGYKMLTFKSGNPKHLAIYGAELPPYNQVGGVATVGNDTRALKVTPDSTIPNKSSFEYYRQPNKYYVNPLYNSSMVYEDGVLVDLKVAKIPSGLPETSQFKPYEGKYFMTNNQNFRNYLDPKEFFAQEDVIIEATGKPNLTLDKNVFIIEEVDSKLIDFGDVGESEAKLYQTLRKNPATGKMEPIHDFHIWVDLTASLPKPYANGSYASSKGDLAQSWKGNTYSKPAKAYTAFMPKITELTNIDPGTVLLNDMQGAPVINYMAEMRAKGKDFFVGKHPALITHNTQEGYIERSSCTNMFIDIADKELRKAVDSDPEYIKALKRGPEAVEEYFKALLPKELLDAQGIPSQFMVGAYYAENGYLPAMSGVSEEYIKKAATDPEFIPALYPVLNKLYNANKLVGINNAVEGTMNPYKLPGLVGYNSEIVLGKTESNPNGYKIKPFTVFDKEKFNPENVDMEHFLQVKRENKINLMERFNPDLLENLKELQKDPKHKYDLNIAVAGLPDKAVEVHGYIDPKYVQAAKDGKPVKLFTIVGRGDKQKAFDTVLEVFEKLEHDQNAVLVMGGLFDKSNPEWVKIENVVIERMLKNENLAGRFVYNRGFSPNWPWFMAADYAPVLSRFAPFEITDIEAMKLGCTPIVTNGQGLKQKNFDSAFKGEESKATSYKTIHQYEMTFEELCSGLCEEDKEKLNKEIRKLKDSINENYCLTHKGKMLTEEEIEKIIKTDAAINYRYKEEILRPYRDKVIVEETYNAIQRAFQEYGGEEHKRRILNQLRMQTDWENNGALSQTGNSSAKRYQDIHFSQKDGGIKAEDTLLAKLRKNCESILNNYKKTTNSATSIQNTTKKTKKNWIIGGLVAIAGLSLGYAISKASGKEEKHLSEVV